MYSFWIAGSRAGGVKNGPLLFGALQIAYDNKLTSNSAIYKLTNICQLTRFVGWSAQHSTSSDFRDIQIDTDSRAGGLPETSNTYQICTDPLFHT
jgi:hypothetical protein